ncbi:hypothetical protein [uncultured Sphingomonas sp.]|uniref:hypothetical protein n=1 Tax=uncultured Sphingomonas sp. TaxID=158754 RepID=UPI0025D56B9F|nr:hypothetical protein [uncultured Sphingomonas sp.]
MLTILALAATLATQAAPSDRPTWATLTYREALRRDEQTVYGFGRSRDPAPHAAWIRRIRTVAGVQMVDWADGKRCSNVGRVIQAFADLPPVKPRLPFDGNDGEIVMDGMSVTLDVESSYGSAYGTRLTLKTNVGTPLADFAAKLRTELEPCWSTTPPA